MSYKITTKDIKKFRVAYTKYVSMESQEKIKSLDFSYNGETLIANTNKILNVIKIDDRLSKAAIPSFKYGLGIVKFFDLHFVICTSAKHYFPDPVKNLALRLLDLDSEGFKRYFQGHTEKVVSLSVSSNYNIASGSRDKTVLLWDERSDTPRRKLAFDSTPLVAYHPSGEFFAVCHDSSIIKIFSRKKLSEEINKKEHEKLPGVEWTSLKYSNDGKLLMVTTNFKRVIIFCAETLDELHNLIGNTNLPFSGFVDACFAPESNIVFTGSEENSNSVWCLKKSLKKFDLHSGHENPCPLVLFNPAYMLFVSAGDNIHLWIEDDL
ncbi:CLUMA_CG004747, isoform A [Clunio marinus]|uniref:CLUMA_CG004747, isoform A n=1 Tax=Clunio marinus TaxID=568069 RepID=A0A1J1HST9_9DIPT|nr:CLUMA_CG004747, isoform A [Clunio marinus]